MIGDQRQVAGHQSFGNGTGRVGDEDNVEPDLAQRIADKASVLLGRAQRRQLSVIRVTYYDRGPRRLTVWLVDGQAGDRGANAGRDKQQSHHACAPDQHDEA